MSIQRVFFISLAIGMTCLLAPLGWILWDIFRPASWPTASAAMRWGYANWGVIVVPCIFCGGMIIGGLIVHLYWSK